MKMIIQFDSRIFKMDEMQQLTRERLARYIPGGVTGGVRLR